MLGAPQRPVIVVPGYGLSRLFDPKTGRFVWGTAHAAVQRTFADNLELDPGDRLVPRGFAGSRGPLNFAWQLREALRKFGGYTPEADLFTFAYDWRRSSMENARELDVLVQRVRNGGKVDIVTHSAGALVGLRYAEQHPESVENLILVAPPQRGVADAFRLLVRGERLIRRTFSPAMAATWPSAYELLPEDGRFLIDENGQPIDFDVWDPASWARIGVTIDPELLAAARRRPVSNVKTYVLAGDCVPTTKRVLRRKDGTYAFYLEELREPEKRLAGVMFEPGDGTVPVSSATAGGDAFLFCDGHQGIATDPNVHRAFVRLLREQ
jgi:pimeloyl-ACP methyl ester carboxylesterase